MTNTAMGAPAPAIFSFDKNQVRMVTRDGEPWFVARDVAEALGYPETTTSNMTKTVAHVPDEWKGRYRIPTPGGSQDLLVISEQGLYFFLGRSDKPKALPFQMWLAGDVLPSIRKTGKYESQAYQQGAKDTLSADEQAMLREAMKSAADTLPKDQQAGFMIAGWSKLKAHFGVSYRMIPAHEFEEALSLISRHIAQGLPAPQQPTIQQHFQSKRWLAHMTDNGSLYFQEVEPNHLIIIPAQLPDMLRDPGSSFPRELIPQVIQACAMRLGAPRV